MINNNKELFNKSLKYFFITFICMFLGPTIIYQAFKNQGHSWYIPVLVIGLLIALTAIILGFYSVKLMVDSFFNKKN